MKILIAPTEDFIKKEKDTLTSDATAGSSVVLNVESGINFAVNNFIIVGTEGKETAEICQISAVTANTITVATLALGHKANEPITGIRYNKRKFYGSLTETGTYTELTADGSPLLLMINNPQGTTIEYTGGEGYLYFKSTYYNSQTSTESNIDDATAVYGNDALHYCSLYAIRVQAGLTNNPYITDGRLEEKRIQAENEINSILFRMYVLPLTEIVPLITRLTVLLAAGYVDFEEYGPDGQGVKWLGEARAILKQIMEGQRTLVGSDGTELARQTLTQGIQSYPSSVDDNNGPRQFFKMGQRF